MYKQVLNDVSFAKVQRNMKLDMLKMWCVIIYYGEAGNAYTVIHIGHMDDTSFVHLL